MCNVRETGSQSNLFRFPQQSRDAQNCDGDADTELQNSHDDQCDVRSCQQALYGQSCLKLCILYMKLTVGQIIFNFFYWIEYIF